MYQTQDEDGDDLHRQILQSTLDEVAAREEDVTDCCVICLEEITEPCEALPCGHRNFDYLCVANWLFETPQCPLCKAKVLKVVHGPPDALISTLFDVKPAAATPSGASSTRSNGSTNVNRRGRFACRGVRARRFQDIPTTAVTAVSDAVTARRDVYRHQRYSKHVGSNRVSRYRELTPQMFRTDEELISRARMWVRRELRVFSFLSLDSEGEADGDFAQPRASGARTAVQRRRANHAEFLLEYILAILKSVDIMGSGGQAEDMLSDFLGRDNTKLFLHEMRAWLRSPFTKLEDWDRAVQYETSAERSSPRIEAPRRTAADDGITRPSREERKMRHRAGQRGDFYRPGQGHGRGLYRSRENLGRRRSRSPPR